MKHLKLYCAAILSMVGSTLVVCSASPADRALQSAAFEGKLETVENALEREGAKIDAVNSRGDTALALAARQGHCNVINYLAEKGADKEAENKNTGYTILMQVVRENYQDRPQVNPIQTIECLLDAGVNIDHINKYGTALIVAANENKLNIATYLVKRGASLRAVDASGNTALAVAIKKNYADIVRFLIKTDIQQVTSDNVYGILKVAAHAQDASLIQMIKDQGFSLDTQNIAGELLLANVIQAGDIKAVKFLIEQGANPYSKDSLGRNAFDYAHDNEPIREILWTSGYQKPSEQLVLTEGVQDEIEKIVFDLQQIQKKIDPGLSFDEEEKKAAAQSFAPVENHPTQTDAHYNQFREQIEQEYPNVLMDPLVTQILARENSASQQGEYVFYRAEPGKYRVYRYFLEALYRLTKLYSKQTPFVWNRFFKNAATERTIYDYIQVKRPAHAGAIVEPELNVVISANLALFGNITKVPESTWHYFSQNKEAVTLDIKELFVRIFEAYGFDKKYLHQLLNISTGEASNFATLQQIIIPPQIVDDIAMMADIGYAVPWSQEIDAATWNADLKRHTKISSILDAYKTGKITINDRWQARILMNSMYGLNPDSGIKIYTYTRLPESVLKALQTKVDTITAQIFREWWEEMIQQGTIPAIIADEPLGDVLKYLEENKGEQQLAQSIILQQHAPASFWSLYAKKGVLDRRAIGELYVKDCDRDAEQNRFMPKKDNSIARIATYNVHEWNNPFGKKNVQQILAVMNTIDADIWILQEAVIMNLEPGLSAYDYFQKRGYVHHEFMPIRADVGNMILSKYPLAKEPLKKVYANQSALFSRNFINIVVTLPNGLPLSVYGTYLDVSDASGARRDKEVKELLTVVRADIHQNIVLAADWNAVRLRDYQYTVAGALVWDLATKNFLERDGKYLNIKTIPTATLEYIEKSGFSDCFSRAGFAGPKYTVWNGTVIDFIFCSPAWNLPIAGCYVYYDAASDHVPVIMDLALDGEQERKESVAQESPTAPGIAQQLVAPKMPASEEQLTQPTKESISSRGSEQQQSEESVWEPSIQSQKRWRRKLKRQSEQE